jgi:hypothetical protein
MVSIPCSLHAHSIDLFDFLVYAQSHEGGLILNAAIGPFEDIALILFHIDHKAFCFESCSKPEQAGIATHNPD